MSRPRRLSFWILLPLVFLVAIVAIVLIRTAGDTERRLYALDAGSGKVVWSVPVALDFDAYGNPTVADGKVFMVSNDRYAADGRNHWQMDTYDSATGQHLWTYAPFGTGGVPHMCLSMVGSSPIVADGRVYVWVCSSPQSDESKGLDKTAVVALDSAGGKVLWEHDAPDLNRSMNLGSPLSLTVIGDTAYLLSQNSNLHWNIDALDTKTGQSQRQFDLIDLAGHEPTDVPAPSFMADGQTLFANIANLMAIDPASGNIRYQVSVNQVPWLADKALFGRARTSGTEALASYSQADGSILWQTIVDQKLIPDAPEGELSLAYQASGDANNVYVYVTQPPTQQTWLVAFRRSDGSAAWTVSMGKQEFFTDLVYRAASNGQVVAWYQMDDEGNRSIHAVSAADGKPLWTIHADTQGQPLLMDDQRVYFLDESPRFRNWLGALNIAWH